MSMPDESKIIAVPCSPRRGASTKSLKLSRLMAAAIAPRTLPCSGELKVIITSVRRC